jgi:hypothetical protein
MPGSSPGMTAERADSRQAAILRQTRHRITALPISTSPVKQRMRIRAHNFAISRHGLPEVCLELPALKYRGRREDRVRAAPAVSCAIAHKERAHEHTGSAGASRPSLRSGFTAYSELSPVNGSFATVIMRILPHHLTPAPRRQDHTTSPYASCALVFCALRVHRIPPHVRDDRERPSMGETRGIKSVICPTG